MENKKIITILLVIIVILCACLGIMFYQMTNAKQPTKLKITSNKTLYEGDSLSVKLTDKNKTAISNETVSILIVDKDGKMVLNKTVKTNSKGKAKLDINLTKGKYAVNVTYDGNKNYTGSNATQNLTVEEVVTQSVSDSSSGNAYVDSILNDPSCIVVKDPYEICPIHGVPYWQDGYCDWFLQPF